MRAAEGLLTGLPVEIRAISFGGTNCYLLKNRGGFILVDTGLPKQRGKIIEEMEKAGCKPGNLRIIIVTHGDLDHAGNCAYLREKYGTRAAIHRSETESVEKGSMLLNRKYRNSPLSKIVNVMYNISLLFMNWGKFERFKPDLYLEEGDNLAEYGLDARIIHIPGHSHGSLGVLTGAGDLFCGDLIVNKGHPYINNLIDDPEAATASIRKLKDLKIGTVYSGHGRPFLMEHFWDNYR